MLLAATIDDVRPATTRAALLRVRPDRTLPFTAGQAVTLGAHGQPLRRPYSIAIAPREARDSGTLEFLVGLGPDGSPGPHLPTLSRGERVELDGPFGVFTFPAAPSEARVLFVAGGSGIAPLRAMLHEALRVEPPMHVSVLYSARAPGDFAFSGELTALEREGRLRLLCTATRTAGPAWDGARGRISRAELEAVVDDPATTLCFVCGPEALVHEVPRMLRDIGVSPERIRVDEWGAQPPPEQSR